MVNVHIYNKGDSHEFHGIKCEIKRIKLVDFPRYEKDGWKLTPEELTKKTRSKKEE